MAVTVTQGKFGETICFQFFSGHVIFPYVSLQDMIYFQAHGMEVNYHPQLWW